MLFAIIIATAIISVFCFRSEKATTGLALSPYMVRHRRQWYRIITHGFVHGDWTHLLINMIVLFSFGAYVYDLFDGGLPARSVIPDSMHAGTAFALLYFGGMVFSSIYDLVKYSNNAKFLSLGASGAVSSVVFASILYSPLSKIYFFGIIPIPAVLFGILYLAYETFAARSGRGRINHHAHIFGAIYGLIFPLTVGGTKQLGLFFEALGL